MIFKQKAIACYTIIHKELKRTLRLWVQTLLPPAVTTTLYFLIFGHLIGKRIGPMAGLPYIDFIVPGLIMMSMLTASFSASVSVLFSAKFQRSIEEILISPMRSTNIVFSFMCVGICRGLLVGLMVGIIALLFTHISVHHIFFMLFVAIIACAIFALIGVLNGIYAHTFDQISIIPTFIITPLSYLGGIFYSLTILPAVWQKVALLNPIIYIISTFRFAFYSHADIDIKVSIGIMVLLWALLFLLGVKLVQSRKGLAE